MYTRNYYRKEMLPGTDWKLAFGSSVGPLAQTENLHLAVMLA